MCARNTVSVFWSLLLAEGASRLSLKYTLAINPFGFDVPGNRRRLNIPRHQTASL
jgi:hypothetical protein